MKRVPSRAATHPPRTIGVLICSYKRPAQLVRCLQALSAQSRRPDDVVVVVREGDRATLNALETRAVDHLPLRIVTVDAPGLIHARNAGLAAHNTDVVTFTDDDTVASTDWISQIFGHFALDQALGGLGGRDRCHDGEAFDDRRRRPVGRRQWFGRVIGNHHVGYGRPRRVDFLKGANMSYRAEAIAGLRFDTRLRGQGSQPHDDFAFSLAVRRAGWRLVYDPAVLVDHYAGRRDEPRPYVAAIGLADAAGFFDGCHNYVVAMWDALNPAQRGAYVAYAMIVGTRVQPGLVQVARMMPSEGLTAWRKFAICQRAHWAAYALLLRSPERPENEVRTEEALS